jgi:hypothetical protein
MGSSSSGGSSSSKAKKAITAATVGGSLLGPVGGAIAGGLAGLSGTSANKSSGASPGMVVPGTPQTNVKNTYNGQGYVDLLTNPQAQSEWPFKDVQAPNGQYVPLSDAVNAFNTTQPVAPIEEPYDPTKYINELKEAQRQSRIAALEKARENALSSLESYKTNTLASLDTQRNKGLTQLETEQSAIAPVYYDKRNQAAAASDVNAMNFAQYMAARGIKGAAGAMPEIYRQAGLQGQIGALDRAEASDIADIERRRSQLGTDYDTLVNALNQDYNQKVLGVNTNYDADLVQAQADIDAQALQNYINQLNLNRQYELQVGQAIGSIGGTPTLEARRFDWSRSSSNPDVQAQILANRARELENTAKEIENSYLPATLKLQAKRLEDQVRAGSLDYDTALAQLNQIKAQTANYNRLASGGGSSGGLTTSQELSSQKAMNDWVTKQVENDSRLLPDYSNYQQLYDAWKNMYVQNMYGG